MNIENPKHASNSSDKQAPTSTSGGGVFIAIGAIGGVFAGGFLGQPSAGLLIGLAVGSLAALAIWWTGR